MLADPRAPSRARRRFRRAVAESAPRRRSGRASGPLSELRRQPAGGVQAGDRAVRRQHRARGSQRAGSAARRTTRSSTSGWRATTASRASTAAGSAASTLPNPTQRGGLLAHGALLATTSYPDRTSPVLRGKWLLNNIFGLPVPPPPPGVDTNLAENKPGAAPTSIRERLAQHRTDPGCAQLPLGDRSARASRWRTSTRSAAGGRWTRPGRPVDASGTTAERREGRRARRPARAAARAAGAVSAHRHREAAGVRARPPARVLRSAGGAEDRPRRGGAPTTAGRRSSSASSKSPTFLMRAPRGDRAVDGTDVRR